MSNLHAAKDLKSDSHQLVFDDCVADKNQKKISKYFYMVEK